MLRPWKSYQKSHPDHGESFEYTSADGSSSKSPESTAERWLPLPTALGPLQVASQPTLSQHHPAFELLHSAPAKPSHFWITSEIYRGIVAMAASDQARQTSNNSNRNNMTCRPSSSHHIVQSHQNKPHNSALPPHKLVSPSAITTLDETTLHFLLTP